MDNWGLTLNGGPNHTGLCHNCEEPNGSNHDGLCESCQSMQPRECPLCGCNYEWTEITEHGICNYCLRPRNRNARNGKRNQPDRQD